jgi:hypothetical protein
MKNIFLLLALLAVASSSFAVVTDLTLSRDIQVDLLRTSPSIVTDESEFTAYLVFTNTGDEPHTISFSIVSSSIFSHIAGTVDYKDIEISPGESVNYEIHVYAKELVLGNNPLKIGIREGDATAIKTIFVTGSLEKKFIDITTGPMVMEGEDRVHFNLSLDPSEDFYNVHVRFGLEDLPMLIENDDNLKIIPHLSGKTEVPITLVLDEAATSQIYNIDMSIEANDANSNEYLSDTHMSLKVELPDDVAIGKVTSSPQTLQRDTRNNIINIEVANMGSDEIENLEATLVIDNDGFSPTYFASESDFLGSIGSKERKEAIVKFDIDDSVESGIHPANLHLTYYHLGKSKSKTIPLNLSVQKLPYFTINQTTNIKDADGYISFFVTNEGDECNSVEVSGLTRNLPISWVQNSDKAARLDEGETKEFRLQFNFNELAVDKEYGVPIRIRCVYNQEPVVQEEEISVISTGKDENFLPFILIGGFLVAMIFLVGKYFLSKKTEG